MLLFQRGQPWGRSTRHPGPPPAGLGSSLHQVRASTASGGSRKYPASIASTTPFNRLGAGRLTMPRASVRSRSPNPGRTTDGVHGIAHPAGADDGLVAVGPKQRMVGDWRRYLRGGDDEELGRTLLRHERTPNESGQAGRPLSDARFLARLEASLGRVLRPRKPGAKRKGGAN